MSEQARLLIVDDDVQMCELLQQCLKPVACDVHVISEGQRVLERLEKEPCDVVILDIMLPDANGIELLRQIRERWPEIDVIMLTAYASIKSSVESLRLGAYDYVTKPFYPEHIRSAVERALEKQALAREQKKTAEALRQRARELSLLNRAGQALSSVRDLDQLLTTVLEQVCSLLNVAASSVWLIDPEAEELICRQATGPQAAVVQGWRLVPGEGLAGWVARAGESLNAPDAQADPRHYDGVDQKTGLPIRSILTVPLSVKGKTIGVLQVVDTEAGRFSKADQALIETLVASAAAAIENARLAEEAAEIEILHELNRLRSELIANVSHELRTPLGLIKVFCTTLLREDADLDRDTQHEFLHDIDEETDKLERIVDNLLDLSRMDSGRLRLESRPTDIGQLACEVTDTIGTQSDEHSLACDFPAEPLVVSVDAKRIEQVLRNLLNNAIKYSPNGGTITVRGRGDEWQVLVSIKDEGIGIPTHELERVFDRFYRVENKVTQRVRGAGLGLSVCQSIIQAHGGRIWAESSLGRGSTFFFTLPTGRQSPEVSSQ